TRRIDVGEIDHIGTKATSGSDRAVWIALLPRLKNPKDWGRCGRQPLPVVVKLRIVRRKRTPPRCDDRVFRLEQKGLVECVVRNKTVDLKGFDGQAIAVIVYGLLGDWLYVYVMGDPGPQP